MDSMLSELTDIWPTYGAYMLLGLVISIAVLMIISVVLGNMTASLVLGLANIGFCLGFIYHQRSKIAKVGDSMKIFTDFRTPCSFLIYGNQYQCAFSLQMFRWKNASRKWKRKPLFYFLFYYLLYFQRKTKTTRTTEENEWCFKEARQTMRETSWKFNIHDTNKDLSVLKIHSSYIELMI